MKVYKKISLYKEYNKLIVNRKKNHVKNNSLNKALTSKNKQHAVSKKNVKNIESIRRLRQFF